MSFRESQTSTLEPDRRRSGIVAGLRATGESKLFALPEAERRWVVGSGPSCDLVLNDPYVSDMHCVLERRTGGSLLVRDKRSRNGTRVDGNFVEGAELRVGSYLTIGRTTLVAVAGPGSKDESALAAMRGHDPAFRATIEQALRTAATDCNVLIVGETGTGKDLLARVIHEASRRAAGKYVPVNCGGIPRELIGSELFGHERGAFTGAHADRDGYFVEAHGGTLFLDELGELPIEQQPHLLRAIETRQVRRIGGTSERAVDVRIIAATNRLEGLGTESSRLRLDLYHRIATVVLVLPPLRERMGDLVELVEHMLEQSVPEHGEKTICEDAWKALLTYPWPGNVRELRHAVSRAVALGGETLQAADFFHDPRVGGGHRTPLTGIGTGPFAIVGHALGLGGGLGGGVGSGLGAGGGGGGLGAGGGSGPSSGEEQPLQPYHAMMRGAMEQALATHGTIRAAAEFLGIPKSTFADRAKAWGLLPRPRPRRRFPAGSGSR